MRLVAWFVLNAVDDVLEFMRDARRRIEARRFLAENPGVTIYYPDGERQ